MNRDSLANPPDGPSPTRATPPTGDVWHVSTDLRTRGGVASYVREIKATPLWARWSIRHFVTHRDGSGRDKALAFARGLASYTVALARRRPAAVHLHMGVGASFLRKAIMFWMARAFGVATVLHVHGSKFESFHANAPFPLRRAIRATLSAATVVIGLGERRAESLRAMAPRANVIAVANAVHLADPTPPPTDGPVRVLFLGAIGERKGAFTLVEAWRRVVEAGGRPATLLMAGDGEVERARAAVAAAGVGDTVEVRSWLSAEQVQEELRSAHVLVLPSLDEGQPMAILEAMAHGLCVVATDVGGIPDLVEDGASGLLVPPRDVDALAAALGKVVKDEDLRAQLAAAAHTRAATTFDIEVVWRRLDDVYAGIASAGRRKPLRVMFVVPDLRHGGAERHVATLAPAMDRSRFAPSVVCVGEPGQLFGDVERAGVPAVALRRTKREFPRAVLELAGHMRRIRPDVVITRGYNAEALGRVAAVLTRVRRTAIWIHNCAPIQARSPIRNLFDRAMEPFTSAYLGVTHAQLPYLTSTLGYPVRKIRIVYNGVSPERFDCPAAAERGRAAAVALGIEPTDKVIGILAVLRPEKDHETLLRSTAVVCEEVPDAKLLVIGDGPLRPDLERLAGQLGIADRVVFAGARDDVADLLSVLDVVALSSRTDCFPIALLEAMAAGRPVVGTAVGGVPEIVDDGVTGLLVPPADPAALGKALVTVIGDPARAREMGEAGKRRVVSTFTLDGSVRAAEAEIEQIAGRRPSTR